METILNTTNSEQEEDHSDSIEISNIHANEAPRKALRDSEIIDPVAILKLNFEKFITDLKENMNKCKFRKCLEDIRDKESLFAYCEDNWQINELKIKCMLKIINKKFTKYLGNSKIKGLDDWLKRVDDEINKWFEILMKFENNLESETFRIQLEICMKVVLEQCYNYALQAKNEKHIADCAGFLGLGERLIRFSSDFTNDPENLNISQRILLFISSLLIADKDFETAKIYQANSLRLAYRELYFRLDLDEGINLKNINKIDQYFIEKVFLNIVIGFYQIGVCEENLGSIVRAIEAYKQAKWFALNFIKQQMPELTQLVSDVEKRATNYHILINNVKNNEQNFKENTKGKNRKNEPKLFFDEFETIKKFEKTIKALEKLKIEEIEEDDIHQKKSGKIKSILSTVKMINNLMSDKFRGIIKSMEKIQITKFDKDTKEQIQKKLNEIKIEKAYLEKEQYRKNGKEKEKANSNSNNNTNRGFSAKGQGSNFSSPFIKTEYSVNNKSPKPGVFNYNFQQKNIKTNLNNYTNSITNIETNPVKQFTTEATENSELGYLVSSKPQSPKIKIRPQTGMVHSNNMKYAKSTRAMSAYGRKPTEEVEKFKYSEFVFNKKFRSKMDYLDKMTNREYNFQKKLLTLKRYEKTHIDDFDSKKIKQNCETFFNKMLKNKTKVLKEDENINKKKEILNEGNRKNEILMSKLESKVIKSLDPKTFSVYSNFSKHQNKSNFTLRKEFNVDSADSIPDKFSIDQKNKEHFFKVEMELENLKRIEDSYNRDIHPYSCKNENSGTKTSFVIRKSVDNFIKRK